MRTIEYKVSYENMISRIPGLFAYLDYDELGNMVLCKSTDSIDGCYGKIVENIKLPSDCGCNIPYYQKRYTTDCYVNTLNPLDVITDYEYYNLLTEDSYLDSSFGYYIIWNDGYYAWLADKYLPVTVHPMDEKPSAKVDNQDYIKVGDEFYKWSDEGNEYSPITFITSEDETLPTTNKGEEYEDDIKLVLSEDKVKNYVLTSDFNKTITEEEYSQIDDEEEKSTYAESYVDIRDNETYLTPQEYEAISIKGGKTYSYRTLISYYYEFKSYLDENNNFIKFIERGIGKIKVGDISMFEPSTENEKFKILAKYELVPVFIYLVNVRNLYNEMVKLSKKCEFFEKKKDDKELCCLCDKFGKMGGELFIEYLKKLIPIADDIANEYFGYAAQDKDTMTLDFFVDLTSSYEDLGIMTPYAPQWIPYKTYEVGDKVVYDGELYICIETNNGLWSEEYLSVLFPTTKFKLYDGAFSDMTTTAEPVYDEDDIIVDFTTKYNYNEKTVVKNQEWYDGSATKHIANETKDVKDYNTLKTNETFAEPIVITGVTDTKLKDLRRFATYYNRDNVAELPEEGTDWLFYYRKNHIVNITTINDNLGNVKDFNTGETAVNSNDYLAAFGDFIYDINLNSDEHTITFVYYLGVHLKAEEDPVLKIDDDGNKIYNWKSFVWDNDEKIGTKYTETYNYIEGSDLDKLINEELKFTTIIETRAITFEDYIEGRYDIALQNYKFEFSTLNNTNTYTIDIANQTADITSILSDYELKRNDYNDFTEAELFREDYLNGITYNPTRDINVKIERGTTSCFEKCICFSEIKTLEDLENYHNGSFFNINDY